MTSRGKKSPTPKIKLIIIDLYGVMFFGSYKDTCLWLCHKYGFDYEKCYQIVYHKYFQQAIEHQISEKQSFTLAAKELGIKESGREIRVTHLSFQRLNQPMFNLAKKLHCQGYKILLLLKNTPSQFKAVAGKLNFKKYFAVTNTYYLKIDKHSPQMIKYILKKYHLKPAEIIMTDDQEFNLTHPRRLGVHTICYLNYAKFKEELTNFLNY